MTAASVIKCPKCGKKFAVPAADGAGGTNRAPEAAATRARKESPRPEQPDEELRDEEMEEQPQRRAVRKKRKQKADLGGAAVWAIIFVATLVLVGGGISAIVIWQGSKQTKEPNLIAQQPSGRDANSLPDTENAIALRPNRVAAPRAKTKAHVEIPDGPLAPRVEDWLQDLEEAKRQAAKEKKDIFLAFLGSDWDGDSQHLKHEVFDDPAFLLELSKHYVPVLIDSPRRPAAKAKVKDLARNEKAKEHYFAEGLPLLIYADGQGLPYAGSLGYQGGGTYRYLSLLEINWRAGRERDRLRDRIEKAFEKAKLAFAVEVYEWLRKARVHYFYSDWVADWVKLADKYDAANEMGFAEVFFEAQWLMQLRAAGRAAEKDEYKEDDTPVPVAASKSLPEGVARFEKWKEKHPLKDDNVAVRLYRIAAYLTHKAGMKYETFHYLRTAAKLEPSDNNLKRWVASLKKSLQAPSSGTGFVVAVVPSGGYILTNHHVIEGEGEVLVAIPNTAKGVPAKVLASDEVNDLALIQVPVDANPPPPIPLSPRRQINRGEQVVAFGFPWGEKLGSSVKLSDGKISSIPELANKNMIGFTAQVTHGNSGGPLCDDYGNVVGVVTSGRGISEAFSLNLARPSWDVEVFLKRSLQGYNPVKPRNKKISVADVDRLVSRSVLMIVHQPPRLPDPSKKD